MLRVDKSIRGGEGGLTREPLITAQALWAQVRNVLLPRHHRHQQHLC